MFSAESAISKWQPILEHADAAPIKDNYRKSVTAVLLENQEKALAEERGMLNEVAPGTNAASSATYDPVLISLVRRAMPQLIAYDIAGVQPMKAPTGLIFALKSRYNNIGGDTSAITTADSEALFNDVKDTFSGPDATATGEGNIDANMGFTIEKTTVTATTRALKAEYTMELAQDLKAVHGLDAEGELANILSQEILVEINREIIGDIRTGAKTGASQAGISTAGTFDLIADADGRWSVEKFMSLLFQIEVDANGILTDTRRGKGNWVVCHSDVASALAATGRLNSEGVGTGSVSSDWASNTLVGKIGGMKVYVDPFASAGDVIVGYRGTNPYDAGYFYAPYVPLTMVRAIDPSSFQPKIAFKTRYGKTHNPLTSGSADSNIYFRNFQVTNIGIEG